MSEPTQSDVRDSVRPWPGWCCSYCSAPLEPRPHGLFCAAENRFFASVDGVYRLLTEERYLEIQRILEERRRSRPEPERLASRSLMDLAFASVASALGVAPWRVLQVGAGDCAVAFEAMRRGHQVVAADVDLDPDHGLVSARRDETLAARLPRVEADPDTLPFEPASFDLVIAAGALRRGAAARALIELRRVTRSGGMLAVWGTAVVRRRSRRDADASWALEDLPILFAETGWRLGVRGWPSRPREIVEDMLGRLRFSARRVRSPLLIARRNG